MQTTSLRQMQQEMFAKIDASGDGSLDKTELTSWLEQMPSAQDDQNMDADSLITELDTDGDGVISATEMAAFQPPMPPGPPPEAMQSSNSGTQSAAAKSINVVV